MNEAEKLMALTMAALANPVTAGSSPEETAKNAVAVAMATLIELREVKI